MNDNDDAIADILSYQSTKTVKLELDIMKYSQINPLTGAYDGTYVVIEKLMGAIEYDFFFEYALEKTERN